MTATPLSDIDNLEASANNHVKFDSWMSVKATVILSLIARVRTAEAEIDRLRALGSEKMEKPE